MEGTLCEENYIQGNITASSCTYYTIYTLGVSSPLCILELSRLTHIEKAVKNTTIFVIYKVLVYIQMSQPTTCFGLF